MEKGVKFSSSDIKKTKSHNRNTHFYQAENILKKPKNRVLLAIIFLLIIFDIVLLVFLITKPTESDLIIEEYEATPESSLTVEVNKYIERYKENPSNEDIKATISEQEQLIANTDSNEEKAAIYLSLANYLNSHNENKEYNEQIMSYALEADKILQNLDSALTVYNFAVDINDQAMQDKYDQIITERQGPIDNSKPEGESSG